jgi:tetratricopeptide (TPR) repeat protein
MRTIFFLAAILVAALAWPSPARAQVTDSERAAARELFKEGDELQRTGKFTEALDKFQRAQKVYSAPTNELRIAECQAALGQLVEATESYRTALRMPLPPGSPPAFQAAVDQAKTELAQVEPRVPKLVVHVAPANANPQLQIGRAHV